MLARPQPAALTRSRNPTTVHTKIQLFDRARSIHCRNCAFCWHYKFTTINECWADQICLCLAHCRHHHRRRFHQLRPSPLVMHCCCCCCFSFHVPSCSRRKRVGAEIYKTLLDCVLCTTWCIQTCSGNCHPNGQANGIKMSTMRERARSIRSHSQAKIEITRPYMWQGAWLERELSLSPGCRMFSIIYTYARTPSW